MKQKTREQKVQDFHKATDATPDKFMDMLDLRGKLIVEEAKEVVEVLETLQMEWARHRDVSRGSMSALLKELTDLQYVLSGTVVDLELTDVFDTAFNRTHESNMSKLGVDGKPVKNAYGKVLKGPNYKAPIMEDLV